MAQYSQRTQPMHRRTVWLTTSGRGDLLNKKDLKYKSYEICSVHFVDSAIKTIKLLKPNTVPTIFLPDQSQADSSHSHTYIGSISIPTKIKSENSISDDEIKETTTRNKAKTKIPNLSIKNKRYCIVYGCLNSDKKLPDLSFFSLPKDVERRRLWLTSINREDLLTREDLRNKSHEVCSIHFEDSAMKVVKLLKPNALPTMFLPDHSQEFHSQKSERIKSESSILSNDRVKDPTTASVGTQTEISKLPKRKSQTDKTSRKRKLSTEPQIQK